jgi:hypothetical protein
MRVGTWSWLGREGSVVLVAGVLCLILILISPYLLYGRTRMYRPYLQRLRQREGQHRPPICAPQPSCPSDLAMQLALCTAAQRQTQMTCPHLGEFGFVVADEEGLCVGGGGSLPLTISGAAANLSAPATTGSTGYVRTETSVLRGVLVQYALPEPNLQQPTQLSRQALPAIGALYVGTRVLPPAAVRRRVDLRWTSCARIKEGVLHPYLQRPGSRLLLSHRVGTPVQGPLQFQVNARVGKGFYQIIIQPETPH